MANKFNVVVDAPLTKAQASALNKDIQALVLKHIARIDNGVLAQRVKFPKEWIGIWVKQFATPELLKKNLNYRQVRR